MVRVFLCDDSELFRTVVRVQLTAHGHEVVGEGGDGAACVAGVATTHPEVVLLDHVLPTPPALAALRAEMPQVKVILYAGMLASDLAVEAEIVGADAFLSKASPFEELGALVREVAARP